MRTLALGALVVLTACGGAPESVFTDGTGGSSGGDAPTSMGGIDAGGTGSGGQPSSEGGAVTAAIEGGRSGASATGGEPNAAGGSIDVSKGGASSSGGVSVIATGGAGLGLGGAPAQGGSASGGTGSGGAAKGGATAAGGAGGASVSLDPYPAPSCPGFVALQSAGLNTCIALRGKFIASTPAGEWCSSTSGAVIETCGIVRDGKGTSGVSPVVFVKDMGGLTIRRAELDAQGHCPFVCP